MPEASATTTSGAANTTLAPTATARPPATAPSVSAAVSTGTPANIKTEVPNTKSQLTAQGKATTATASGAAATATMKGIADTTATVTGTANTTDSKSTNSDPVDNLDFKAIANALHDGAKKYLAKEKSGNQKNNDQGKNRANRVQDFVEFLRDALIANETTASTTATAAAPNTQSQALQIIKKYILLLYLALKKIDSTLFKDYIKAEIKAKQLILDAPDTRSILEKPFTKAPKDYPTQWLEEYYAHEKQVDGDISHLISLLDSGEPKDNHHLIEMIIFSLIEEWQIVIVSSDQQRDAAVQGWNDYWQVCEGPLNKFYDSMNYKVDDLIKGETDKEIKKQTQLQMESITASQRAKMACKAITNSTSTADTKQTINLGEIAVDTKRIRDQYTASKMNSIYMIEFFKNNQSWVMYCSYKKLAELIVRTLDPYTKGNARQYDVLIQLFTKFAASDELPSTMFVLLLSAFVISLYDTTGGEEVIKKVFAAINRGNMGLPMQTRYMSYYSDAVDSCKLDGQFRDSGKHYVGEPVLYIAHDFLPFKIGISDIWYKNTAKVNYLNTVLIDAYRVLGESFSADVDDASVKNQWVARLEYVLSIAYIKLINEINTFSNPRINVHYKIAYLRNFVEYINHIGKNPANREHHVIDEKSNQLPQQPSEIVPSAPANSAAAPADGIVANPSVSAASVPSPSVVNPEAKSNAYAVPPADVPPPPYNQSEGESVSAGPEVATSVASTNSQTNVTVSSDARTAPAALSVNSQYTVLTPTSSSGAATANVALPSSTNSAGMEAVRHSFWAQPVTVPVTVDDCTVELTALDHMLMHATIGIADIQDKSGAGYSRLNSLFEHIVQARQNLLKPTEPVVKVVVASSQPSPPGPKPPAP